MLTMTYRYRIYPDNTQQEKLSGWMETCRVAYNYGLAEIKIGVIVGNARSIDVA